MTETRKIDIALVMKTKDAQGRLLTRVAPDGRVIPDPLIVTRNFGVPDGIEMRFSLWDLDAEILMPLMSGSPTPEQFEDFRSLQHDRMQQLVSTGQIDGMIRQHDDQRRIAELERQVSARGPASND